MSLTDWLRSIDNNNSSITALTCGDERHTYGELKDAVTRLAGAFLEMGVSKGDRICILSQNSDRAIISFWAAMWAGCTPNFMNTRWALNELSLSLDDCEATVLLLDESFLELGEELKSGAASLKQLIFLGDESKCTLDIPTYDQVVKSAPCVDDQSGNGNDDAFLNYTGGTTGKGKGVVHTHTSLGSGLDSCFVAGFYTPKNTLGLVVPLFHVSGILSMSATLRSEGTLVVVPAFRPSGLLKLIVEHNIGMLMMVPTMCRMFISAPEFNDYDLTCLTSIHYGGSPIDKPLLKDLLAALPHATFMQVYGQTECAPVSFLHTENHLPGADEEHLQSAGNAADGVTLEIRDDNGKAVPEGEVGEICFTGDQLMSRYWDQPEVTAKTLINGWCHSGDVGRLKDGYLYVVDRLKDMIISGGENIYTAEVESALASCPDVDECAVIGVKDEKWGERVHAFIVMKDDVAADEEKIVEHCRSLLAGYKLPRTFTKIDRLPTTAVGKIDKVALRKMA